MTTSTPTSALLTPYKAAKEVNAQLLEMNIDKVIPAQMIYTYVKKGYITSTLVGEKRMIAPEDLAAWFVIYVERAKLNAQLKALRVSNV